MFQKTLSILVAVLILSAGTLTAGTDQPVHKEKHATFSGTLVCLGCDLKKTEGANAMCSAYGHTYALKTADGRYINFLENKFSEGLISGKKYRGKTIAVEGTFFADADMLDVETFTVDGKKMGWCNHCKSMDNCPFKKSGMK